MVDRNTGQIRRTLLAGTLKCGGQRGVSAAVRKPPRSRWGDGGGSQRQPVKWGQT
jgi:hypothetical protein